LYCKEKRPGRVYLMEGHFGYRLLLMALIIAANGFFALAETAIVVSRASRLKPLAANGIVGAQAALSLLANPARLLSVGQVGVTLASLALGWIGEDTLYSIFFGAMAPLVSPVTRTWIAATCLVVSFLLMTFLHVVIGEVVPKNLAINKSERLAILVAPVLLVFYKAVEPFVWIIERAAAFLSKLVGVTSDPHGRVHSVEELDFIISASHAAGHLTKFEQRAIQNLIGLQDYAVREVMVPRNSLVMVPAAANIDELLSVMRESRYSRIPVYEGSRENIIGIVHVKDVLDFWTERRQSNLKRRAVAPFELSKIIRKAPVVPETKPLNQVLDTLREEHSHVAIVVDEFGNIVGLISMEDVMEQIFGEIEDEFDPQHQPRPLEAPAVLEVDGITSIVDLDSHYAIELPSGLGFETLAGFLLFHLGHIPAAGEEFGYGGRRFTILEMDGNRIGQVRIERLETAG
jgi:putative hemolysin